MPISQKADPEPAAIAIRELARDELIPLESLLRENSLPDEDCAEQAGNFVGLFESGQLIAAGGLEPSGDYVLLRSVVVHPDHRSRGFGRSMTEFLLARAAGRGFAAVYLLTETAEGYFRAFGFAPVARDEVPAAIARTRQFASLCPESAACMMLHLPIR